MTKGSYAVGYGVLLIPAVFALASLSVARLRFPVPSDLAAEKPSRQAGFTRAYWLSMAAGACFAAGLMSFELISYHLSTSKVVGEAWIPVLLAISTAFGVVANLVLGKSYDRFGTIVLVAAVVVSSLFSPLVFLGGFWLVLCGMLLWGIGYATQDTLLKAVIAGALPEAKRGLAFGLFYAGYGGGWLVGSIVAGLLYQRSLIGLVAFSILAQLVSIPFFMVAGRSRSR